MWPFSKATPAPERSQSWLVANGQMRAIQSDQDILDLLGGGIGLDGLPSSVVDRAKAFPASAACLRLISTLVASAPVHVYRRVSSDTRERQRDHIAEQLMNDFSSEWEPSTEFVRLMTLEAMFSGEAFAQVLRKRGQPVELNMLTSVGVQYDQYTGRPLYRATVAEGQYRELNFRDVIHVRSPTGGAPVKQAAKAIELGLALENSALGLFKAGSRPSGILTMEGRMDAKSAEAARKEWREEGIRTGEIRILGAGMKFQSLVMNSTDAEHIANRQQQVLDVSRTFGVPPTLLSHLEDATLANVEHLFRQLVTTCIDPWLDTWRGALTRCLLTDEERKAGFYIEHETADLISADIKATAEALEKEVGGPVMTPNEARSRRNLPAVDGGDRLYPPRGAARQETPSES